MKDARHSAPSEHEVTPGEGYNFATSCFVFLEGLGYPNPRAVVSRFAADVLRRAALSSIRDAVGTPAKLEAADNAKALVRALTDHVLEAIEHACAPDHPAMRD